MMCVYKLEEITFYSKCISLKCFQFSLFFLPLFVTYYYHFSRFILQLYMIFNVLNFPPCIYVLCCYESLRKHSLNYSSQFIKSPWFYAYKNNLEYECTNGTKSYKFCVLGQNVSRNRFSRLTSRGLPILKYKSISHNPISSPRYVKN